jgi:aryl-alcohol dehydrogenase-like predicted oxidoreductase
MMQPDKAVTDETVGTLMFGDISVRRLGFGAMRVSGARDAEGVRDRAEAIRLCQQVAERGVNLIDTANIYGYGESEEILAEALHPYDGLLIATKAGFKPGKIAPGATSLPPLGEPKHIREECDKSLRRLRLDVIDVYQVHVPDPEVPYEDTVGAFVELQRLGKVRHIGVCNVSVEQLALARSLCTVVSVQNRYNIGDRASRAVLDVCERDGIAFMPWGPLLVGDDADGLLAQISNSYGATTQQVALAWLLRRSPVMAPIPGTTNVDHATENIDSAWLDLAANDVAALDEVA